jgi:hypothetical protein
MRALAVVTLLLFVVAGAEGQGDKGKTFKRYSIELETKRYPQGTPKEALGSVLKAIAENQVDYLLAHLADPDFVDKRVALYASQLGPTVKDDAKTFVAFDRLTKKTIENFLEDPSKVKDLKRFLEDGKWDEQEKLAVASLDNVKARRVFMKRLPDDRWVLLDREK